MKYVEIRKAFIEYFKEHGHQPVASSSLIPHNDPTLMFTNAGMNQFKDVFIGKESREYNRAVTIQKCLRAGGKHNDLENVGFTARHHTFFEMMGNFSFGDYFKKEAISFAWDFLTKRLNIPEERLYVTVFETDDEAEEIWNKEIGVPKEKIFRFGEKDNFWRMGQTGPCGPCSEIFYDHNPSGPKISIDQDEDRFVEIWNLVFMQFFEDEEGKQTPLPKPSVDTGAGIERIASAMQGFSDNYQCDVFQPLIHKACQEAGIPSDWLHLAQDANLLGATKVVADHARAATFLIGEGVLPSNEGPGYVLRRIMRRAIRYARKLNEQKSIYPKVVEEVIHIMGEHYPELKDKKDFIIQAVEDEEARFLQTLDKGSDILMEKILELKKKQKTEIDGETAFTLYDTYGFPLDLTQVIAKEQGLTVDEAGFHTSMEAAKDMARKAQKSHTISSDQKHLAEWSQNLKATSFVGYEQLSVESELVALSDGSKETDTLSGDGWLVFHSTPFYAEGGGQSGDIGEIFDGNTVVGVVSDCQKMNDVFLHQVTLKTTLEKGKKYTLKVTAPERQATANNHSATHLLNAALKKVLGDHVNQAGSLVNPLKLRFDFSHNKPVSDAELAQVEALVNEQIALAEPVSQAVMSHKQAVSEGAVAMFGEKYGSEVRVISMGQLEPGVSFSKELCGGTHVSNTSQIRLFKIVSESGVAAGTRRIEALTGERAFQYLNELAEENKMIRLMNSLPMPKVDDQVFVGELAGRVTSSSDESDKRSELKQILEKQKQEIKQLKQDLKNKASQSVSVDDILKSAENKTMGGEEGVALFTRVEISDRKLLSEVADKIRDKQKNIAMVLIGESENGPKPLIVAVSKGLKSLHAGKITKELCDLLDGKGGGRPDFAQGSVANLDKLKQAKDKFYELIQ